MTIDRALRKVDAKDLGSLRQVVLRHQLPRGASVLSLFGLSKERWLKGSLVGAQACHALLNRIEVVPTVLAEEAQPDVEDGRRDAGAPVGSIEGQGRQALVEQQSANVGAAISKHSEAAKPNQRGCRIERKRPSRKRPRYLERLHRSVTQRAGG